MQKDGEYHARIARAKELLQSTRHMALATVNADGSPHNSPVFFAYDTDLNFYWASGQDTQHSQNIARDGQVFIPLFNSQENGGGLYIKAHAAPVSGHEFAASLAVVNTHRQAWGRPAASPKMYQGDAPQRLYKAKPITTWVNVTEYDGNGGPFKEYRREVAPQLLGKGLGQRAITPVLRVAAKAVIMNEQGEVLLVRESTTADTNTQSGKYGIPGGRLEPGEAFVDGLKREAREETGLNVVPRKPIYVGEWRPTIKGVPHQIVAIFMLCKAASANVTLSAEHDAFAWVNQDTAGAYTIMPPDDAVLEQCWQLATGLF